MGRMNRRTFLKGSLAAGAVPAIAISGTKASGKIIGANDRIRIAVAGLHGRGKSHVSGYVGLKNVEIAYLVDPDSKVFGKALDAVKKKGKSAPKTIADIREALDDKDLTAVSIATPNHWHSLMTIWACQAGKHVYVEKPCSHDVFEGRIAVEASRRHNVIVQHGTQQRSSSGRAGLMEAIHSGKFGKLVVSHGYCCKPRGSIGVQKPEAPPSNLNWDLWQGPADVGEFHRNYVHYNWHWFWKTGNGDIGNQGVHEMDVALWALKGATLPRRVMSLGGRFGWDDQGQTPNSQLAIMDFGDGRYVFFTVRNLNYKGYKRQVTNDFYFEDCRIVGGKLYRNGSDKAEKLSIPKGKVTGGGTFGSFIATIRAGKREMTNGDILDAHYSSALGHLANISYCLGEKVPFNKKTKAFGDNKAAYDAFASLHEILAGGCKLPADKTEYRVGPWLAFDPETERFTGERAEKANALLHDTNRKGYVVPAKDKV